MVLGVSPFCLTIEDPFRGESLGYDCRNYFPVWYHTIQVRNTDQNNTGTSFNLVAFLNSQHIKKKIAHKFLISTFDQIKIDNKKGIQKADSS
jgi:hypothetical protein